MRSNPQRLWRRLELLAETGRSEDRPGVTRLGFSAELEQAYGLVAQWMREAGLQTGMDASGNLIGLLPGSQPDLPAIGIGSHLDTVPSGGAFDGALGVLAALEAIQTLTEFGMRPRRSVAVIAFADEEGINFGIGVLSAQLWTGEIKPEDWSRITDQAGLSLAKRIQDFAPAGLERTERPPLAAFIEAHIEQGPVLDGDGAATAVVDAIVGVYRTTIRFSGSANHAGTTPMSYRRDALWPAAGTVLKLRQFAFETAGRAVLTVGKLEVSPGATNVVPGEVSMRVEIRSAEADLLESLVLQTEETAKKEAQNHRVDVHVAAWHRAPPVTLHQTVTRALAAGMEAAGLPARSMPSWAGHDTKVMARHMPAGMIFVPSPGGTSHSPAERSTEEDCHNAAEVLLHTILHLDEHLPEE